MKTRRGYQGNVLLVEMIVVLLFFSLSAVISMGVIRKLLRRVSRCTMCPTSRRRSRCCRAKSPYPTPGAETGTQRSRQF